AAGVGNGDILYGQGFAGVYWYKATGETAKTDAAGKTYNVLQYQTSPNLYGNFGSQQGWSSANGFQILKTSTSDAAASILGFGYSGIVVGPQAFASGASAAGSYVIPLDAGNASGWNQTVDIRSFTDLNGKTIDLNSDGIADLVGMTPRLVGDVTGDGIPDIVGFGYNSTYVAVGSRDSSGNLSFKLDPTTTIGDFGSVEGWSGSTEQTVRALGTFPSTGGGSHSDLILSGLSNTQIWHYI